MTWSDLLFWSGRLSVSDSKYEGVRLSSSRLEAALFSLFYTGFDYSRVEGKKYPEFR